MIYRQGNDVKDEIVALSPPVDFIGDSLALGLSIPFALAEFTGRQEPILLVLASIMVLVPIAFLVRGLICIRWWSRALRIALKWCAENNHVMPHDLGW